MELAFHLHRRLVLQDMNDNTRRQRLNSCRALAHHEACVRAGHALIWFRLRKMLRQVVPFSPAIFLESVMPRFFSLIFLLAGMLFTLPARAEMPRMELIVGFHRIEAEVAADAQSRAQGLMHRKSMGANQGMLFVFPFAERHCMWMRNTLIPLAVAFLDDEGKIINIEEMQAQTENNHCAAAPARFALEMNQGWFSAKGIRNGVRIGGVEKSPRPR